MLLNDIVEAINENEETAWESEAPFTYYEVEYDIEVKRVEVFFVEEYHYDGDNWGEIETKCNKRRIFFAEHILPQKYMNLLIYVVNADQQELEYEYGDALKKVSFVRV